MAANEIQDFEKLYEPSQWSRRFNSPLEVLTNYMAATAKESEQSRRNVEYEEGIAYGERSNAKLDIYGGNALPLDSPIFVFFHGGYWISGERKHSSFMVQPLFRNGIISIIVGYTLIPEATMEELVSEIHKAMVYIDGWARKRGSKRIYLCGHSAGSHLAAMILSKEWADSTSLEFIKGIIHISGVLNLHPLLQTSLKQQLSLTEEIVKANSPQFLLPVAVQNMKANKCAALILVGEHDSPAFQQQSREYHEGLENAGVDTQYMLVNEEDHFSIVEKMQDENFVVTQKIIELVKRK